MAKFQTVYRRKAQGKKYPRVGLPDSIQPGDYLTIFIDGAYHARICASVHKGYVITEKMVWKDYVLDSPRKVPWDEIDSADRPLAPAVVEQPPPEPEVEQPAPTSRTRS